MSVGAVRAQGRAIGAKDAAVAAVMDRAPLDTRAPAWDHNGDHDHSTDAGLRGRGAAPRVLRRLARAARRANPGNRGARAARGDAGLSRRWRGARPAAGP